MTLTASSFSAFHAAVHGGQPPFAWQHRLLAQVVKQKRWPRVLDLPTGAGKTTCIDIALFALALDAVNEPQERWCPRRIAMVVDRRVVVDQAAERGRRLLQALTTSHDPVVREVARRLRSLSCAAEDPIGVFTLRGGMPKDDGWARTPDQPLIIASTVDQIGSRMLVQGYGVSPGMRPVHAGLLANDTLLLLDEVHLSEPFRQTLDQLASLRRPFTAGALRSRFAYAFLSATPGVDSEGTFRLLDEETQPDSPLGRRLHVSKPTRIVEVADRAALEHACVAQAKALLERHRTIAVVVNRVASANAIAVQLTEQLPPPARVTLLTGRMRPLDRDDVLRELRPLVQTGRRRDEHSPPHVVVATQCLEAGADFDFDAMVTEAASLESLRQRFGRVDRLGEYGKAEGVIVYDNRRKLKDELKQRGESPSRANDPIYGAALDETVKWLAAQARRSGGRARGAEPRVDFGIAALKLPTGDELQALLAPRPNAPTLLPAYLDLWAQTSPPPSPVPDVSLWLHGPAAGPAEVQVVWRADLPQEVLEAGALEASQKPDHAATTAPQEVVAGKALETATAIVAAVRPSSLEAVSLPFAVARAWLAGAPGVGDLADTEGPVVAVSEEQRARSRWALCWQGDESRLVTASTLRPGATIVVPASYGGIQRGSFDATSQDPVPDRAEQASLFARARPVLRLHPEVVKGLGLSLPLEDETEARDALRRFATTADWPAWKRLWAERLARGRSSFAVPADEPWTVIEARRLPLRQLRQLRRVLPEDTLEDGIELTTDGDDSFCAGRAVSLARHSRDVEALAHTYATSCGLGTALALHLALAGWLHDIGKADRRFQIMLRGGSEIDYFKDETPWAKSPMPPGARAARKLARERSGYPGGGYFHAVQSVAMLEGRTTFLAECLRKVDPTLQPDIDLVVYLVASHHGECRPFAPVVVDEQPVNVSLPGHWSERFGTVDFPPTTSGHSLHRLDSSFAERFWTLIRKYGWLELCWLEAILRLADHHASEEERDAAPQT